MAHARQTIREAFVTACTGLATTGSNVFDSQIYPNDPASLPLLAVYAARETSLYATLTKLERTLELVVEGKAREVPGQSLEDVLDTIAAEVETACTIIASAAIAAAGVKDVMIANTEITLDRSGDNPHGVVKLTFAVLYFTPNGSPGAAV